MKFEINFVPLRIWNTVIQDSRTKTKRKGAERRMEYWMEPELSCLCQSIPATFGFLRISTLQQRFSEKKRKGHV